MLLDNSINRCQPQSGTECSLGGEKRLKNFLLHFLAHPFTGISYCQHDIWTGDNTLMIFRIIFIQKYVGCFNTDASTFRHGISGINDKIHQYLLYLAGVSLDIVDLITGINLEINIFSNDAAQ